MMADNKKGDLISRSRLLRDIYFQEGRYPETHLLRMAINEQPAVDAVKVMHGWWEDNKSIPGTYVCNKCGKHAVLKHNFCNRCGAKMDGKKSEKEVAKSGKQQSAAQSCEA